MTYFVITTKHHEGFCLWDSKLTPAGRDLHKPMVRAFRSHHSLRNHPDREQLNHGRDQLKYVTCLHGQVRELLTQFGPVDVFWFDFSYPNDPQKPEWLYLRH